MALTTSLQLTQTTKLSPQQIQLIRMLELPTVDLQQRVNEELVNNPALEEGRDPQLEREQMQDEDMNQEEEFVNRLQGEDARYGGYEGGDDDYNDDTPDYMLRSNNYSEDGSETREFGFSGGTSLLEYLKSQVYLTKMTKPQRHIAKWVLGNIDDDGYLRRTTENLVDDLSFQEGLMVSDEEMQQIVDQIKRFDPPGVAAFDLQECLINQLKQKHPTRAVDNAIAILSMCFESFTKRHFDKVASRLALTEEDMKDAIDEIVHLNQKPANAFTGNQQYEQHKQSIIPDFYIENRDGELVMTLNTGDIPELHVSEDYTEMMKDYASKPVKTQDEKEAVRFIRGKLDSAQWFIDAIKQRNETLYRTMSAILKAQKEFFIEGDDAYLKPMILQDIADRTGYDVSTISRVSNSKYVQTEFGIYPLKHFFSEGMQNDAGDDVSTREIKKILREVIAAEDKREPLNDDRLVEVLKEHGYLIARRTVAKYREQLGVSVARLRKEV